MKQERKFPLNLLLKIAKISKSTFYYEINKIDSDLKNKEIIKKIIEIFKKHHKNYGVRRVYHELKNLGYLINHKKVQRLMKKLGLTALKHKQKTILIKELLVLLQTI